MEKFQNIHHLGVKLQSTLPQYEKLLTTDYVQLFQETVAYQDLFLPKNKYLKIDSLIYA